MAFGLPDIASLYDPSVAVDQVALQRQAALAQALRQQSMTPIETSGRQIGGMGYRISPLEGVAKILQGMQASGLEKQTDQDRLAFAQRMAMAVRSAMGGEGQGAPTAGAPAGAAPTDAQGASVAPQSAPQSQPQGGGFSLANLVRGGLVNDIGGVGMGAAFAKNFETPESVRALIATGQNPQTVGDFTTAKLRRDVNAPVPLRGVAYQDATGIHGLPQELPGAVNVPDPTAPGGWKTLPVPGGAAAIESSSAATAGGKAQFTPFSGFDINGKPTPVTSLASALRVPSPPAAPQPAVQVPPDVQAQRDDGRIAILKAELAKETDPALRADIQKEIDGTKNGTATVSPKSGVYAAQPLGTPEAIKSMYTSWEAQKAANREAQNTSSYLDNIVQAAHKGAITGPNADKRELAQGFLQLAGINVSVNESAVTQTQLLDKYHNQIVTRLSQGGLSTDQARAMLDSAYPGKPMNLGAIDEAAANLKGAQAMTQARTRFLLDPATKTDAAEYQRREVAFDQNADPRVFQWMSITDPNQRKAFVEQTLKVDPSFLDRAKKLRELGAIQ